MPRSSDTFESQSSAKPQWYPGHIAKWDRQVVEQLKQVDVVLEVADARLPEATIHPELAERLQSKPLLRVMNKASLADPTQSKAWQTLFNERKEAVLFTDAHSSQGKNQLLKRLLIMAQPRFEKQKAKGLKPGAARVMVVGLPNVGKSSLINTMVGKRKVQTGHKAGVTRHTNWIRVHPQIDLLDSPGLIPPRLDSKEIGLSLALVSSIGEAAFDDIEVARYLLAQLTALYPQLLSEHFGGQQPNSLEAVAELRQYKVSETEWDCLRAAQALLKDFRKGRLGRLTLEQVTFTADAREDV